jgi:hypothetical protein
MAPEVLEEIRRAHCARKDEGPHACVGVATITREGATFDCRVCGDEAQPRAPRPSAALDMAKAVLAAAGLEFDALCPDRQQAAVHAAGALRCPGCGTVHVAREDRALETIYCGCGGWHLEAWRRERQWQRLDRTGRKA